MGAPWFKLYANDLLSDSKIRLLTDDQLGKLVKLWAFACKDGSIPSDLAIASRLLGNCSSEDLAPLKSFFRVSDEDPSLMVSERMMREQGKYVEKCEKLRHNASIGGKKKAENAKAKALANAKANALAKPAESESESEDKEVQPSVVVPAKAETKPEPKAKKEKPAKKAEPSLQEILGGKGSQTWERFWKMVAVWGRDKVPAPKALAHAWLAACEKDEPRSIYLAALHYRDEFLPPKKKTEETQFMKSPLAWLQEEAWNVELQALALEEVKGA